MRSLSGEVLILDANQRSALAVTRSLGALGLNIITADDSVDALSGHSRYSLKYIRCPSTEDHPEQFLAWLKGFIDDNSIKWVFPVKETTSQLILSAGEVLGTAKIPFSPLEKVMRLADKWRLMELARAVGVPHPKSLLFSSAVDFRAQDIPFSFPIVLKPCLSRRYLEDRWLSTTVHVAHSLKDLQRLLAEKVYFREYPFMIQEYIEGHGAGVFALYNRGHPLAFFAHRRLREKPPQGGVSVLCKSVELQEPALSYAKSLLDAAEWHGVAMVEFRVTAQGVPYLMEVNTRFWGSLQLAIDSGVDFPQLLYRASIGEDVTPIETYRKDQHLRWLLGDIDSLYLMLRDKRYTAKQRFAYLLKFLKPLPTTRRYEINRWGDLKPALFELKAYLRALHK